MGYFFRQIDNMSWFVCGTIIHKQGFTAAYNTPLDFGHIATDTGYTFGGYSTSYTVHQRLVNKFDWWIAIFFLYNNRVLNAWKRYFHHSLCPSARLRLHSTHRRTYRNNALVKILKCGKYYQICCGYSARVSSGGCRLPLLLSHHNVLATGSLGGMHVLQWSMCAQGHFWPFIQIIQ